MRGSKPRADNSDGGGSELQEKESRHLVPLGEALRYWARLGFINFGGPAGQIALAVTLDALNHKFQGGFVETPTTIVDKDNVVPVLQKVDALYPKPSKSY